MIQPPPPIVNTDVPPMASNGSPCKKDRCATHSAVGSCASCHKSMDPIGFGLENFDLGGKWRTVEAAHPECAIDGKGSLEGIGSFSGAQGLATLLVGSGQLEPCVTRQMFRFATGRTEASDDLPWVKQLARGFKDGGRQLDVLLLDFVSNDAFGYRTLEAL